jgi:hypothetical protein
VSFRSLDSNDNIIALHGAKHTSRWNRVIQPWKLGRVSLWYKADIESVNGKNHKHVDFTASQKASGTVSSCASERAIACAPHQAFVIQEPSRIELGNVATKNCRIEMHLSVWHEYLVSRQEILVPYFDFAGNDTGADGVIGNSQDFFIDRREEMALV